MVLRATFAAGDGHGVFFEVHVGPTQRGRFVQAAAGVGEEFDEVGPWLRFPLAVWPAIRLADCRNQLLELFTGWNLNLRLHHFAPFQVIGGVFKDEPELRGVAKYAAHQLQLPVHGHRCQVLTALGQPSLAMLALDVPNRKAGEKR